MGKAIVQSEIDGEGGMEGERKSKGQGWPCIYSALGRARRLLAVTISLSRSNQQPHLPLVATGKFFSGTLGCRKVQAGLKAWATQTQRAGQSVMLEERQAVQSCDVVVTMDIDILRMRDVGVVVYCL